MPPCTTIRDDKYLGMVALRFLFCPVSICVDREIVKGNGLRWIQKLSWNTYRRKTPPRREAFRHSGGESLLWTSPTVTLYFDVELSRESLPGTLQNTSLGVDTPERPSSLPLSKWRGFIPETDDEEKKSSIALVGFAGWTTATVSNWFLVLPDWGKGIFYIYIFFLLGDVTNQNWSRET